jgi:hypothetical protein
MNILLRILNMANWIYKKGKWLEDGKPIKENYLNFRDDANIVKFQKPEGFYIPIKITTGVYSPSSKERSGKKIQVINICNISDYCECSLYGKPSVKCSITMNNHDVFYPEETWLQIDQLCTAAVNLSKSKQLEPQKVVKLDV